MTSPVRLRLVAKGFAAACALLAAACTSPSGEPASGFLTPQLQAAYIPLEASRWILFRGDAAGVALGDGVAVTNAHNGNLIDAKTIIGRSTDYDLLFFHTDRPGGLTTAVPQVGEHVVAYGQDGSGVLRRADGVVAALDAPMKPECAMCKPQTVLTFKGNAGPGFSGGPVVDAESGRLLGIVVAYEDRPGGRLIYAYPMTRVRAELAAVARSLPVDKD